MLQILLYDMYCRCVSEYGIQSLKDPELTPSLNSEIMGIYCMLTLYLTRPTAL